MSLSAQQKFEAVVAAELADAFSDSNATPQGFLKIGLVNDAASGLDAACFLQKSTGDVYFTVRGADLVAGSADTNAAVQLIVNDALNIASRNAQFDRMLRFVDDMATKTNGFSQFKGRDIHEVVFSGHSLGGAMAAGAAAYALETNDPTNRIAHDLQGRVAAFTFGAIGIDSALHASGIFTPAATLEHDIVNFVFRNDILAHLSSDHDRTGQEYYLPAENPAPGQGSLVNGLLVHDTTYYAGALEHLFSGFVSPLLV